MSLARVYTIPKVRKEWKCGKCGDLIPKGGTRVAFAVGFRGRQQTRCTKVSCAPSRGERESSAVAAVYEAQDNVDLSSIDNTDDFKAARDEVSEATREVASEYESNEMYDINVDLQDRAEQLNSAADTLDEWEPENEEPVEDDWDEDSEGGSFEDAHSDWVETTRDSLENAINDMDLP